MHCDRNQGVGRYMFEHADMMPPQKKKCQIWLRISSGTVQSRENLPCPALRRHSMLARGRGTHWTGIRLVCVSEGHMLGRNWIVRRA